MARHAVMSSAMSERASRRSWLLDTRQVRSHTSNSSLAFIANLTNALDKAGFPWTDLALKPSLPDKHVLPSASCCTFNSKTYVVNEDHQQLEHSIHGRAGCDTSISLFNEISMFFGRLGSANKEWRDS